jgi:hypothetical protein
METFCYGDVLLQGDVLLRRRFVTETFCRGDVLLGDVLSRRRFVRRPFVCASLYHFKRQQCVAHLLQSELYTHCLS